VELAYRAEAIDVDNEFVRGLMEEFRVLFNGNVALHLTKSGARTYTAGIRWMLNPNVVIQG
jgi:hypothetical protein